MNDQPPSQSEPPQEEQPLLPLWSTVNKAYALAWRHRSTYLKISAVWMPLMFLATWLPVYMAWPALKIFPCSGMSEWMKHQNEPTNTLAQHINNWLPIIISIIGLLIIPSIAVAWHRLLLRDEKPTKGIYLRYDQTVIDYMLIALVILFFISAPTLIILFIPSITGFLLAIMGILTIILTTRIPIMLPARALGRKDITINSTLQITQWNFWRLFWAEMFCTLPGPIITFYVQNTGCDMGRPSASAIYAFAQTANIFVMTPIYLTFLSLGYKHFFERAQPDTVAVQETPRFPLKTMLIVLLALGVYKGYRGFGEMSHAVKNLPAYYQTACNSSNNPDDVITACTYLIQEGSKDPTVYNNRAIAEAHAGKLDDAITDLNQVIYLAPHNSSYRVERGTFLMADSRYKDALADFNKVLKDNTMSSNGMINAILLRQRGTAQFYALSPKASIENFQQAVQDNPNDDGALVWLHIARMRAGENDAAEFERRVAALPDTAPNMPILRFYLGKSTFDDALKKASDTDERCHAYFYGGEFYLSQHKPVQAHDLFSKAKSVCPYGAPEKSFAQTELTGLTPGL